MEKLLSKYPSHNFVIDGVEARELFKNVAEPCDVLRALGDELEDFAEWAMEKDDPVAGFLSDEPPIVAAVPNPNPAPDVAAGGAIGGQDA